MSDIYMHSKMARAIIQKTNRDIDEPIAFLGAQSSDPMYYATFHKEATQYRFYADRMHDTDTQKLLIHLVNYVKEHPTRSTYSFLLGFICHYALDVHIHPYVYHKVGIYHEDDPTTHSYRGLHLKFERSMDAVLIRQDLKIPSRKLQLAKTYFPIKVPNEDVTNMMKSSFHNQFGILNGDEVYQTSVRHMYNVVRFIATDRLGIKKQIYKLYDHFHQKADLFMADLSFFNHEEDFDFLNLKKRSWHHPVTNQEFTTSVPELYEEAIEFARKILDQVDQYIAGTQIDLKTVFTNLSFNSGIDCTRSHPFQYFHIYRP